MTLCTASHRLSSRSGLTTRYIYLSDWCPQIRSHVELVAGCAFNAVDSYTDAEFIVHFAGHKGRRKERCVFPPPSPHRSPTDLTRRPSSCLFSSG